MDNIKNEAASEVIIPGAAPTTPVQIPLDGIDKELDLVLLISHRPTKSVMVAASQSLINYAKLTDDAKGVVLVEGVKQLFAEFKNKLQAYAVANNLDIKQTTVDTAGNAVAAA